MAIDTTTEKRFESDIEASFMSSAGGYTPNNDAYNPALGLFPRRKQILQETHLKE